MDLAELREEIAVRHPWEAARVGAIEKILRSKGVDGPRAILDYGCGDAYTGRALLETLGAEQLVGLDPHLTEEQCRSFAGDDARIRLTNQIDIVRGQQFDLVLLCDVIEHVEDDRVLLSLARESLSRNGRVVVTVPAFQALFTEHDRMLKHHRRYSLGALEASVRRAGLEVEFSGYLFASLLPIRGTEKALELAVGRAGRARGIGQWNGGATVSRLFAGALGLDNTVLLTLAERGIKVPGLSAWALCR